MNSSINTSEGFEVTWKVRGRSLSLVANRDTLNSLLDDLALQGIVPLKVKRVKVHTVKVNIDECFFKR